MKVEFLFKLSLLLFFFFCDVSSTKQTNFKYFDDEAIIERRKLFFSKLGDKISNGSIEFPYEKSKGIFCRAKKELFNGQISLKIPKELILCSFDAFPFKNIIRSYLQNSLKTLSRSGQIESLTDIYSLAISLMFARYEKKNEIYENLKKIGYSIQIVNYHKDLLEAIELLPRDLMNVSVYNDSEKEFASFFNFLTFTIHSSSINSSVLNSLLDLIRNNNKSVSNFILPWLDNYERFSYFIGIITSRAYFENSGGYYRLHDIDTNGKNTSILGLCIIPFADNCNHRSYTKFEPVEGSLDSKLKKQEYRPIDFDISFTKGFVFLSINKWFKPGDEYEYNYLKNSYNEKLLFDYGFTESHDMNPYDFTKIIVSIQKSRLDEFKVYLCKLVNCFDSENYDPYFEMQQDGFIPIMGKVYKKMLNLNLLNLFKIFNLKIDYGSFGINHKSIQHRLEEDIPISYENEILSNLMYFLQLSYSTSVFRSASIKSLQNSKFQLKDILHLLNFNRRITPKEEEKGKHFLRTMITNEARSGLVGFEYNKILVLDRMKTFLYKQFNKIKKSFP